MLYEHFQNTFHVSQKGCRKNRSTIVQLLTYIEMVCKSKENGNRIVSVFTDFSKAFDRADH